VKCKTKPICPWKVSGGDAQPANCAKQTQFGAAWPASGERLCQTKPNVGKLGYIGDGKCGYCGAKHAKRTQFGGSPPGTECAKQTQFGRSAKARRAKCSKRSQLRLVGPPTGLLVQTNPISWGRYPMIPLFYHSTIPIPIVQNKPNLGQPGRHPRSDYAKQSQTWAPWGIWWTGRRTQARCAKQTKLPKAGHRGGVRRGRARRGPRG
jgi:hypothetical protein